jgi:protein-disulfide isomerase
LPQGSRTRCGTSSSSSTTSKANLIDWTAARNDAELANTISSDAQVANNAGFTGTPSFVLSKPGGTLYRLNLGTYTDAAPYDAAIEKLLKD